ncbi:MAG: class I SAM-dependent methyltransferase, partial [Proteiniphilum sp.]|nr:class I SAM-dependent methyltransferase [Proteiniphilum sp.]
RAVDKVEKALISDLLKQVDSREMLELGCGTGHWTAFFSEKGFRVTAVDQSAAMLEQARKKLIPEVQWVEADAAHLPFPDSRFELITAITLFEFAEDRSALFSEIDRLLKPGGFLITGWLNSLSEIGRQKKSSSTFKYAHLYTPVEIRNFLSLLGSPQFQYAVYYDRNFELLDERNDKGDTHPAFIATIVQKTKLHADHH